MNLIVSSTKEEMLRIDCFSKKLYFKGKEKLDSKQWKTQDLETFIERNNESRYKRKGKSPTRGATQDAGQGE